LQLRLRTAHNGDIVGSSPLPSSPSFDQWLPVNSPGAEGLGEAGPSRRALDLNVTPSPEPAPPAPLSAEAEEALRAKRERLKGELRLLLQIGYGSRARPYKKAEDLINWIGIDAEKDPLFLDRLYDHVWELSMTQGGSVGQPQKLSPKGLDELRCWILEQKEKGIKMSHQ
jgi:hypothetical protein